MCVIMYLCIGNMEAIRITNFHIHIAHIKGSTKYISNIYGDVMQSKKKLLLTKPFTTI